MSKLSPQELEKMHKLAFYEDLLTSDMKDSVINAKQRNLNAEIKKALSKKDITIEIFVVRRT
jgi:hypothetical protein